MSILITSVIKNSPAFKAGIKKNDLLISLNGHIIRDVLDYMYYAAEIEVCVVFERDGIEHKVKIIKSEYDDLGLEFESFLMDKKQSCTNKCIFCFIDQMPPNMRETLYFKDDDARLSFLQGNYVTLTNLDQNDIDRIIQMRLNINISVHTTNPELRCKMMNNRFAGEKLKYLKQFADADISMNCQIVLCPGINDGAELERTLSDLGKLMPNIQSVAVVPVGVTKFRDGLYPLTTFDKQTAGEALDMIEKFQGEFIEKYGTRMVFAADEFYITAGRPLPEEEYYEEYSQYENGVGMLRSLINEFHSAMELAEDPTEPRTVSIATGAAAFEFISKLASEVEQKWNNIKCQVYRITNHYFGETITVSGLLTATDIISQLKGKKLGDSLLLTTSMLKRDSDIFLDDMTISDVEQALNIKITVTENDGFDLLDKIIYNN